MCKQTSQSVAIDIDNTNAVSDRILLERFLFIRQAVDAIMRPT